tara:strand:- start:8935 stop:9909 length:975 start_codon:yes stop_codon:yes gene_type:complete
MNLLLIGAGQLGSRHLQSVLKHTKSLNIIVVDNSECSLNVSRERALEIESYKNHKLTFLTKISDVQEQTFDYLIIATGASVRYKILEDVLTRFKIKHAILEKVLFQDLNSYENAAKLIHNHNLSVFVNCPLRVYPFFKKIKECYISTEHKTTLRYTGGEWVGLACNSIHYLDLMNFLCSEELTYINTSNLDDGFIDSKRHGNIEFTGKIEGEYSRGSKISIESIKGSEEDSIIEIANGSFTIIIDELSGNYKVFKNDKLIKESSYEIVYQSDLSHRMLEQIEITGKCELIDFESSAAIHQKFISKLLAHYNLFSTGTTKTLPIT